MIALGLENVEWDKVLPAARAKAIRATLLEEQRIVRCVIRSAVHGFGLSPTLDLRHAYKVLGQVETPSYANRARTCRDLSASLGAVKPDSEQVRFSLLYYDTLLYGLEGAVVVDRRLRPVHWKPRVRREREILAEWVQQHLWG
jgi:hypothetical protein